MVDCDTDPYPLDCVRGTRDAAPCACGVWAAATELKIFPYPLPWLSPVQPHPTPLKTY